MDWADHRVPVVEDDYHTAQDWSHAIRSAGADVIGPYPSAAAAAEALEDESVTAATLDVDLIDGRSYGIAQGLLDRCVPFVFVTGHPCRDLPAAFFAAPCLQKPCEPRDVLAALTTAIAMTR